jgi:hypothetical protein
MDPSTLSRLYYVCLIQLSTEHKHILPRKLYGYFKIGHAREKSFEHKFHSIGILSVGFKIEISCINHKSYFRGLNVHVQYYAIKSHQWYSPDFGGNDV